MPFLALTKFFILAFPITCGDYHGIHNDQCLEDLWEEVGCMPAGTGSPSNIGAPEKAMYASQNIE